MYAIQLRGQCDIWFIPTDPTTGRLAFYEDHATAEQDRRGYSGPSRVVEVKAVAIEPLVSAAGTIAVFDIQGMSGKYRELELGEERTFDTISVREPGKDVRYFKRIK
jgi:hypothetical protein